MKRALILVLVAMLGASVAASAAPVPEADLVEQNALLKEAVLKLSLELNKKDEQLTRAVSLWEQAEADVDALQAERDALVLKLDKALELYRQAEADVTELRVTVKRLMEELEGREAVLAAYRKESDARAFLAGVAGLVGGVAATVLLSFLAGK